MIPYSDTIKFGLSYGLQSNGWKIHYPLIFKNHLKQYAFRIQTVFKKCWDLHTPKIYIKQYSTTRNKSILSTKIQNIKKTTIQTIYSLFSNENGFTAAHIRILVENASTQIHHLSLNQLVIK